MTTSVDELLLSIETGAKARRAEQISSDIFTQRTAGFVTPSLFSNANPPTQHTNILPGYFNPTK